jgi:hypothetical protein
MGRVVSVNLATPDAGDGETTGGTGINKRPVAGPVLVRPPGPMTVGLGSGEPQWVKRFTRHARPGAYLRVVEPGEVRAECTCRGTRSRYRDDFGAGVGQRVPGEVAVLFGDDEAGIGQKN